MLLEFSVENFLSFKDKMTLNMIASSDKSLDNNLINYNGNNLIKCAVVYGPNASGKTNLLKSIGFVKSMVINSHKNQKGDAIRVIPFRLDEKYSNKPSKFELVFIKDGIKYVYGFSADMTKIHEEYLYYYPMGRPAVIFERDHTNNYRFVKDKKEQNELSKRTLDNSLYLSTSSNWNYKRTAKAMEWFVNNVQVETLQEMPIANTKTTEIFNKNERTKEIVKKFLYEADVGIVDLDISVRTLSDKDFAKKIPEPFLEYILKDNPKITEIRTYHYGFDSSGNKVKIPFNFRDESDGSKRMFELTGIIIDVLLNGKLLIIDEFDTNLHPHLVKYLVGLFQNPKKNKNNSQLVFSTHNTYLLKTNLFRRDQIWFTEKRPDQSTDLYSLWDYKPRKDENIEKGYLAGRYGAVPFLGDGDIL